MWSLITGSNGYLGRNLIQYLNPYIRCKTLSKSAGDYRVKLDKYIPIFIESFDLVIHAAGLVHYHSSQNTAHDIFHKVNVIGTKNLLLGLEKKGIPQKFVFISSVAVYGESEGHLINEQSELNAIDPYGKSKIQAEQLVWNWCTHNNVTCTILRLPLIVGLNPPGNLGAMIKGIRKGYYFNIAGGDAKKSMVLAGDVAKFILMASEVGGTFNLTDGYHPSFFELSNSISYQLGKCRPLNLPIWLAKIFALGGDLIGEYAPLNTLKLNKITSTLTFDDSKARVGFGWNPTPVLEGFKIN